MNWDDKALPFQNWNSTQADYEDHAQVMRYLARYGYLRAIGIDDDHAGLEADRIDSQSLDFKRMVERHQQFYWHDKGTQPDGLLGPIGRKLMQQPRCGCADIAHAGSRWALPCSDDLQVYADLEGLRTNASWSSVEEYEHAWYSLFEETKRVCKFDASRVASSAEAHYRAWAGATSGSTLAWSEFPQSCQGQANSRFGTKWNWSKGQFIDTALHEQGHGLGLPHGPAGSVMFWTIDRSHGGRWKDWDRRQLVNRYGEPEPADIEPDPPKKKTVVLILEEDLPKGRHEIEVEGGDDTGGDDDFTW